MLSVPIFPSLSKWLVWITLGCPTMSDIDIKKKKPQTRLKTSGSVLDKVLCRGDLAILLQDDFMVLVALLNLHTGKWPPSLKLLCQNTNPHT